jgi:hypothetical protein
MGVVDVVIVVRLEGVMTYVSLELADGEARALLASGKGHRLI